MRQSQSKWKKTIQYKPLKSTYILQIQYGYKNKIFQDLQIDRIRHQNINNNNVYRKRHHPGIFLINSNHSADTQSSEIDYFPYTYKNRQKSKIDVFDIKKNDGTDYSNSTTGNIIPPKKIGHHNRLPNYTFNSQNQIESVSKRNSEKDLLYFDISISTPNRTLLVTQEDLISCNSDSTLSLSSNLSTFSNTKTDETKNILNKRKTYMGK